MSESVRTILFVELLGGIGDFLIALPAIQAIARSHSDAAMNVLTFARNAELLEQDPLVSRVLIVPDQKNRKDDWARVDFLREVLSQEHFDLIVSDTVYGSIGRLVERSDARLKVTDLWKEPPEDQLIEERFLSILIDEGLVDPVYRRQCQRLRVHRYRNGSSRSGSRCSRRDALWPSWAGRYGLRQPHINIQSPRLCPERRPFDYTEQSCWYSDVCVLHDIRSCIESITVEIVVSELEKVLQVDIGVA